MTLYSRSPQAVDLLSRVHRFMVDHVYPVEDLYEKQLKEGADSFKVPAIFYDLQRRARTEGLWNLFLPHSEFGAGLTNLEYASLAEEMGRVEWASAVFNCSAPDTGNMEVLVRFANEAQKAKYLQPLLDGRTRSCFAMTEPAVASSDATNISAKIERDGDDYVINGRKWFASNAYHPDLAFYILMGRSNASAPSHKQHSQILIDADTPGITKLRWLPVLGYSDLPRGHGEVLFENVRVPAANMILREGAGFEIAQGRLGPGRIHHCMRIIGQCERIFEKMCRRLTTRTAFGSLLSDHGVWQERVAQARTDINMARQLVLHTADLIDRIGVKDARSEISQIKVACAQIGNRIADVAIQAFGAAGLTDDFGMGYHYARMRVLRIADGPDEVHNRTIAQLELRRLGEVR